MSKLPYVVFFLTLLAIAGATVWHYGMGSLASAPEVAVARQQIQLTEAEPEVLPQIQAKAITPEEHIKLHQAVPAGSVSNEDLTTALSAQKAKSQAIARAADVIASSPAVAAAAPGPNLKLYVQLGLTLVFLPLCLYFILSAKFSVTQKNFAYTTVGTILGFWFTSSS